MDHYEKRIDLSASRSHLFEDCAGAFALRYLSTAERVDAAVFAFGSLFHTFAEEYTRALVERGVESDRDVGREISERLFDEQSEVARDRRVEWEDVVDRFLSTLRVDPATLVGIEEWVETPIVLGEREVEDGPPVPIADLWRGKIDLLSITGEVAEVTDYKTDLALPPLSEVSRSFQVRSYAAAVFRAYPQVKRCDVVLLFVRFSTERRVEIHRDEADTIERELRRRGNRVYREVERLRGVLAEKEIEPEIFSKDETRYPVAAVLDVADYRVGVRCPICPFPSICPRLREAAEADPASTPVTDPVEAEARFARVIALDALRKPLLDSLRPYVKTNGPVDTGGMRAEYASSTSPDRDASGVVEILRKEGLAEVEIWKPIKVDERKLLAVLKANEKRGVLPKLESVTVAKTSTRWKIGKAPEDARPVAAEAEAEEPRPNSPEDVGYPRRPAKDVGVAEGARAETPSSVTSTKGDLF